jgi:hypothetical protein
MEKETINRRPPGKKEADINNSSSSTPQIMIID